MGHAAQEVQRQLVQEALDELLCEVQKNEQRKVEQAEKGFDGLTYFVYRTLLDEGIGNAEDVSRQIKAAFLAFPNWRSSEAALRELRQKVTFALVAEAEDINSVVGIVDRLFSLLERAARV